jgi:hypothetical protein
VALQAASAGKTIAQRKARFLISPMLRCSSLQKPDAGTLLRATRGVSTLDGYRT